jgi:hypothetical protein
MNITNIHEGRMPAMLLMVFRQIERLAQGCTLATKLPISPDYFGEACAECKGHGWIKKERDTHAKALPCKACGSDGWSK